MATTSPDNVRTPNPTDPYKLVADLTILASDVQAALVRRANSYVGTSAQRTAFTTAPEGTGWQDTNGTKLAYVRKSGVWVPAIPTISVGRGGFTLSGSTWDSGGGIFNGGTQATLFNTNATIGTRTITPTLAGVWSFNMNGAWAENNAGLRQAAMRKNNVGPTDPAAPGNYAGNQVAASGRTEFSLSLQTQMNGTTDYMAMSVYQNSGIRLGLTWISMTAEYLG